MRLLLHLLLCLLLSLLPFINGNSPDDSIHFNLFRHQPRRVLDIAHSDIHRQASIFQRLSSRRTTCEVKLKRSGNATLKSAFKLPLKSAAYAGVGQYFVRFRVGTPAQKFLLVVDTGSDLTWVKCKYSGAGVVRHLKGTVFEADKSETFRPIRCSSGLCKSTLPFALAKCPASTNPCFYDYVYSDGSTAQGLFANESTTITLLNGHNRTKLPGIIVGCTSSFQGSSFVSSDGVLGIGYSNTSFATLATSRFGGKFSYCLVDHLSPRNVSNYLIFGPHRHNNNVLRYVDLLVGPPLEPFYSIRVIGISIGEQLLNISKVVWDADGGGGVIIDSGTSLTVLATPAYRAVTSVLSKNLTSVPRIDVKPFEFCYNWTGVSLATTAIPRMVVHIGAYGGKGAVRFEPPVKSYLIDVADGIKCLGFLLTPFPGTSTIGNILQQNHLWMFDVGKRRLGFKSSTCVLRN